jgi:DNA-binding CsgD family transcriptional regulator
MSWVPWASNSLWPENSRLGGCAERLRRTCLGRTISLILGEGKTNKEIAEALFRSPNTIKLHVSAILQQLKLKSRTQAALLASRLLKEGSPDLSGGDVKSWKKAHTAAARHKAGKGRGH